MTPTTIATNKTCKVVLFKKMDTQSKLVALSVEVYSLASWIFNPVLSIFPGSITIATNTPMSNAKEDTISK